MQKRDGMNYAPLSRKKTEAVCEYGAFKFGVIGLDHGHIYAMCNGLIEAGAQIVCVWDSDTKKSENFIKRYPDAYIATSEAEILVNEDLILIASAVRPSMRCELGIKVLKHKKDFFVDKPGMLTKEEIEIARETCRDTGKKYIVYFGERIHVEGAAYTEHLINEKKIGDVLQITILAPHRLNKKSRPEWFFEKKENGGIITDLGSHQIEQFLTFSGAKSAKVLQSAVANYRNKEKKNFYDFGEAVLLGDNGVTCWFRVDWFTPDGLSAWGDGRVFIMGSKGSIEIRKYIDPGVSIDGDQVIWIDEKGEHKECVTGKMGFVFFGKLILDCINRTENAITQEHTFEAMSITIDAQERAFVIE